MTERANLIAQSLDLIKTQINEKAEEIDVMKRDFSKFGFTEVMFPDLDPNEDD